MYSLRAHSEKLQLQRALGGEPLLKFPPQEPKAPIGIKTFEKIHVIVVKFRYSENIRGVCIMARPRLRSGPKTIHRARFAAHFWRDVICGPPRVGGPVPHQTSANSIIHQIMAAMEMLGYDQGRGYPHTPLGAGLQRRLKTPGPHSRQRPSQVPGHQPDLSDN